MAEFARVPLPALELGTRPDETSIAEYRQRVTAATRLMRDAGLDVLVVYGDREYFGDLYHLTGVDPRFEEGILVLDASGAGTLLLGNENVNMGPARDIGHEVVLWQELSPPGQRRDQPSTLESMLARAGIGEGAIVGVNGQKRIGGAFFEAAAPLFSAPSYLVEVLRGLVGGTGELRDAKPLFSDPDIGLRSTASAHDIALFEYGANVTSHSVLGAVQGIEVGVHADELSDRLFNRGLPATAHAMLNFGPRNGVCSPLPIRAERGLVYQIAQGVRGGLTCRAGVIAASESDLDPGAAELFVHLARNYFDVVATWHENVRVGADSAEVFEAVDHVRDDDAFAFSLNPGHHLHYEEWSHSSFWSDTHHVLRSGTMLQCDIIPVVSRPDVTMNIEDGLVLADSALRDELADRYPQLWERVLIRRAFLRDEIGVDLDESLLPLSNIPLWHAPFALDPTRNLVR